MSDRALERAIAMELYARAVPPGTPVTNLSVALARSRWQDSYRKRMEHPGAVDDFLVAADAYEEAGDHASATRMRAEAQWNAGEGSPPGLSVPHGVFARLTFRELEDRLASAVQHQGGTLWSGRRWGARRYGPYVGAGGIYFVVVSGGTAGVYSVTSDWRAPHFVFADLTPPATARSDAKSLALGTYGLKKTRRRRQR